MDLDSNIFTMLFPSLLIFEKPTHLQEPCYLLTELASHYFLKSRPIKKPQFLLNLWLQTKNDSLMKIETNHRHIFWRVKSPLAYVAMFFKVCHPPRGCNIATIHNVSFLKVFPRLKWNFDMKYYWWFVS